MPQKEMKSDFFRKGKHKFCNVKIIVFEKSKMLVT
jgi:hypothetical protein